MDEILEYMAKGKWKKDLKRKRKLELWELAKESQREVDVSHKIGGLLIYNQLIDEFLKDIIDYSIYYIKAEIWPASFALKVNYERKTFGQNIEIFSQIATIEPNRELLIQYLKRFNTKRNQVVHNLFATEDLLRLKEEIDEHLILADEILKLLVEYDNSICHEFADLDRREDFDMLFEGFGED